MKTEMEIMETLQGEELHYKRLLELPEYMQNEPDMSYVEGWVEALKWVLGPEIDHLNAWWRPTYNKEEEEDENRG